MNPLVQLTNRETQVAERIAWGASLKEVAYALGISHKTVDNTLQKVYKKAGCGKLNELSAWWFCTHFNISFDLSPMARQIVAAMLLFLYVGGEIITSDEYCRYRTRRCRTRIQIVRNRKSEN